MRAVRGAGRGMSLIELLVVLMLMSLIAAMAVEKLRAFLDEHFWDEDPQALANNMLVTMEHPRAGALKVLGTPVRLQWSREEELAWSPCGSAMAVKIAAAVDATGRIAGWKHELWSHTHIKRPGWSEGVNLLGAWMMDPPLPVPPAKDMPLPAGGGDRNAVPLYDFGHDEVVYHFIGEMPLRVSALRTLGAYANVFAIESMLDEIARAQGFQTLQDPTAPPAVPPYNRIPQLLGVLQAINKKDDASFMPDDLQDFVSLANQVGIDTIEVLQAAGTKWNFLPFRPGLVGGHCIGVDPYYLTHKADMLGYHPQVILAGRRINDSMGKFIAEQTIKHMIASGSYIKGARVNVLGLTFKENCGDLRNSKVIDIINELKTYVTKASKASLPIVQS